MLTIKLKITCDRCGTFVDNRTVLVHVDDENVMRIVNMREVLPPRWRRTNEGEHLCYGCRE